MAAFKVKKLWSVFLTAFFAVLASLGLTAPAAAAGSAVAQPAEQPAPVPAAERMAESRKARAGIPRPLSRDRSLPPTIKQRIRAEAHGSSPSVRHLPVGASVDELIDAHRAAEARNADDIPRRPAADADAALVAA
jgi:hypothetical protein